MPRETNEITTPLGHKLVLYTYLTGRESRELQTPYLKTSEEFPKALIDEKGLRAASFQAVQDITIRTVIASFDGKKDREEGFDLLNEVLNLPASEYNFIMKTINSLVANKDAEEEKKTN